MHLLDKIIENTNADPYDILQFGYEEFGDKVAVELIFDKASSYTDTVSKDLAVITLVALLQTISNNYEDIIKKGVEEEVDFSTFFCHAFNNLASKIAEKFGDEELAQEVLNATVALEKGENNE